MLSNKSVTRLLGGLSIAVVCVDLSLGLWPFHSPHNGVKWVQGANGVYFGRNGTVQRSESLQPPLRSSSFEAATIEIWAQPERWLNSATLVALRHPNGYPLTRLRQSLTDLDVSVESRPASKRNRETTLSVTDALSVPLHQQKLVFITVTSGPVGTKMYLNGVLAQQKSSLIIPSETLMGPLILGDAPAQPDDFRGMIKGLALYSAELRPDQVVRHFETWTSAGRPSIDPTDNGLALYLFDERVGSVIRNHLGAGGDLQVPATYFVVEKMALEPFWNEFDFSRAYWSGNLKNVIGFIPAGFCFYAFWVLERPGRKAVALTLIGGASVSLAIEIFQIYLPMRDSGTTDLLTNTLGTYLGVLLYRKAYLPMASKHPLLAALAGIAAIESSPESSSTHPVRYSPSQTPNSTP